MICESSHHPNVILEYFIHILAYPRLPHPQLPHPRLPHPQLPHPQLPHPQLPHHMMYQPAQQVHMRPQFPPQHQSLQPQQLIGGDAFVSENNLTSSSTGILQASVAINSHRQHVTVDTSTVQYDSYSQQRSQVKLFSILTYLYYCVGNSAWYNVFI